MDLRAAFRLRKLLGLPELDAGVSRLSRSVAVASARRAAMVLALAVATTAICLAYAAFHLGVNSNTKAMLSDELPFRQMTHRLLEAFPQLGEPLIVVVDADTAERAREAAKQLADGLLAYPELFRGVFAPGVGTFFDTHGLLYVDTDSLERFSDRVISALPLISSIAREPTLERFFGLVEKSLTTEDPGRLTPTRVPEMLDAVATILEAPLDSEGAGFSWRRWVLGAAGDDGRRQVLLAEPVLVYDDLKAARRPIEAIRETTAKLGLDDDTSVRVRLTGNAALGADEMDVVVQQTGVIAVAVSVVVVAALLWIALRSGALVAATVVTLICGLSWTTGFAAAAIGHLNLVSIAFAVLFVGLGVDFGIHFGLAYRELRADGLDPESAISVAGGDVGGSIALCAATTAIGFFAFLPTRYAGVAELGLISGVGMFLSFAATLTVLPAFLMLTDRGRHQRTHLIALPDAVVDFPLRRPKLVICCALALGLAALTTLPSVRFDPNPVNVRDPGSESVQALTDLLAESPVSPWTAEILAPDVAAADALAARLEKLDTVGRVVTLSTFVPEAQDDKIEILDDLSFFLEPSLHDAHVSEDPSTEADVDGAIDSLLSAVSAKLADSPDGDYRDGLLRLRGVVERVRADIAAAGDGDARAAQLEEALFGEVPRWLENLDEALHPEPVTLDVLPPSLLSRYLSADGRARVEVFPAGDVSEPHKLEAFVSSVQALTPMTAGSAVEIVESGRAIVVALQQAFAGALVIVTVLLLLLWGSLRDTVLVLSALALAAVLTASATVALDVPLNFADVIVLPLLLGVGVDSGIHLVHRHRAGAGAMVLRTSTARGVMFSALTTIASFGTLAFSSHRGIASLGLLLTVGLCFTLLANLVYLPAMLSWLGPNAEPRLRSARVLTQSE
jgi:hopanoid biosynthesis associated RND transporter like protein HpnN